MIYGSLLHGVGGGGVLCARSRVLIEFLKQTCIDTSGDARENVKKALRFCKPAAARRNIPRVT